MRTDLTGPHQDRETESEKADSGAESGVKSRNSSVAVCKRLRLRLAGARHRIVSPGKDSAGRHMRGGVRKRSNPTPCVTFELLRQRRERTSKMLDFSTCGRGGSSPHVSEKERAEGGFHGGFGARTRAPRPHVADSAEGPGSRQRSHSRREGAVVSERPEAERDGSKREAWWWRWESNPGPVGRGCGDRGHSSAAAMAMTGLPLHPHLALDRGLDMPLDPVAEGPEAGGVLSRPDADALGAGGAGAGVPDGIVLE